MLTSRIENDESDGNDGNGIDGNRKNDRNRKTEATSLKTEATSTGTDATPSALMTELKKDSQERVCFVILLPPNEAKAAYLVSSIKDDRKNIPQKRTILIIVINSLTSDSNNKNNEMTSYLLSVFIEQVIAKIMD
ncbi:uncharacterized protein OCT59_008813 [Rhizophagus irregularis]|uniref:uncharacterized protein n=1 Tax=Rhizophagus irregularis TaxID=588596 RepID=UPI0019E90D37|nr:hypothetical protein OCT59_008813 [Rhizophagus irregularis]GBC24084.2 hypothetical protein GLOIN_2v1771629 [Rhizophagus irregularis DAOM 181602=DAOM 197198]